LVQLLNDEGFRVRAQSKAVFRRKEAAKGLAAALKEASWFSLLSAWQAVASLFGLRRELFVVVQRR
jgi:hypothetical protein